MIAFPNSKINLGLQILERLPDGYHRISSLLYPVPLYDILEILPSGTGKTELQISGLPIPESEIEKNLCYKAWKLLHDEWGIPAVKIYLHKIIPLGAGLGGGSSDAAFALKMLNAIFPLNLSHQRLTELAAKLGMDCPFFITNTHALAEGKGELLTPVELNLSNYHLALVKPEVHISTAAAYAGVVPDATRQPLQELIKAPVSEWKNIIFNDFEKNIFSSHPEIKEIKEKLYGMGAVYAAMSGSGSAVFGLFTEEIPVDRLKNNFPGATVFLLGEA